jgi:hypothetical protein
MNLSQGQQTSYGENAGAVPELGPAHAAPAHFQVGAVGFGPAWTVEDSMAASIVRLEQENQELRAEIAVAEQERAILVRELERLRELVADERARDAEVRESCREKEAADRMGGNPWSAW